MIERCLERKIEGFDRSERVLDKYGDGCGGRPAHYACMRGAVSPLHMTDPGQRRGEQSARFRSDGCGRKC